MKIILVAATRGEISGTGRFLVSSSGEQNNPQKFFYKGIEIDVLIAGAGMTATAFQLGKLFSKTRYDFAINAGVCGSFDRRIKTGEVVNVTEDSFSDFGAEDGEKFLSVFDLGLLKQDDFPFENGILKNHFEIKNKTISEIQKVTGITVNTVHGNTESIQKIIKRNNPQVESMEGAAFLFACLGENIPCVQIRAVSNFVERRNRDAWNIPLAADNLSKKLMQIFDSF